MADETRCRAEFTVPGSNERVVCNRWPAHDGLHRTALVDDGHGTKYGFEWGSHGEVFHLRSRPEDGRG